MTRHIFSLWMVTAALAVCPSASGQTFQYRIQQESSLVTAADGGTVNMTSDGPGRPSPANVTATYSGTTAAVITSAIIVGSPDFSLVNLPRLPQSLFAGQGLNFVLSFQPSSGNKAFALLNIYYTDDTGAKVTTLNLTGSTPEYTLGYVMPPENNFAPLAPGGNLPFPATSLNGSATATIVIGNRGSGAGAVTGVSVSGTAFRLTGLPALPATVASSGEVRVGVIFAPRQSGSQTGTLSVSFADRTFVVQLVGSTANPEFVLSYSFPSDGNVISVSSGATLVFPVTTVNATSNAVISVGNRGGGGGNITAISITGRSFQLAGLPTLPIFVETEKELRIGVTFSPEDIDTATGSVRVVVDDRTLVLNLNGRGAGPRFSYEVIGNGVLTPFLAGAKLSLPDAALRETSNLVMQVRNTGNADGTIAGISISGDAFRLTNVPILPYALPANSGVSFTVTFSPTQPGPANGRLRIGNDSFELQATGKGSRLVYSYVMDGASIELNESRNVLLGSVQVGQSSQVALLIRNAGTTAASLTPILIVEARSAFRLENAPALPAVVDAGGELVLPLLFSPVAVGDNAARLRIGAETFNLVGVGTDPPTLPAIAIRGPGQVLEPLQQSSLSVVLAEPYPLPLSGILTLAVNSTSFVVDPAVQFSTGGRSVAFTIPANETRAQFPTGSEVYFQTGSVAGTINIRATLTARDIDVTPSVAPALDVVIPAGAPRMLDIQLGARTANSLSVVVTGMATTRTLEQLELQFVSSPKYNVPSGKFTLNVGTASSSWYRGRDSEAYGSLFTASIPFNVQTGDALNLDEVFQSISATLTNEKGRSNTLSVTPRQ